METAKGSEYLQKIKEAISSKEYQSYTSPQRPHIVKFAELKSLSNIESCFPYNKDFGNTLKKIAIQEFNVENIKAYVLVKLYSKVLQRQWMSPQMDYSLMNQRPPKN